MSEAPPSLEVHPFPIDIVDHQASGVLELRWQDGSASRLAHGLLRARCRCAACRCSVCESLRRAGHPPGPANDTPVTPLLPVGEMGLQLFFNDGHDRGIFPWPYLHELSTPSSPETGR